MKTVLMAIAVVKDEQDKLLLRKTGPGRNPYQQPWAFFGGRIEGDGIVQELLNKELMERWNFSVTITGGRRVVGTMRYDRASNAKVIK